MNMACLGDRHGSFPRLVGIQSEVTVTIQQVLQLRKMDILVEEKKKSSIFFSSKSRMTRGQAKKSSGLVSKVRNGSE